MNTNEKRKKEARVDLSTLNAIQKLDMVLIGGIGLKLEKRGSETPEVVEKVYSIFYSRLLGMFTFGNATGDEIYFNFLTKSSRTLINQILKFSYVCEDVKEMTWEDFTTLFAQGHDRVILYLYQHMNFIGNKVLNKVAIKNMHIVGSEGFLIERGKWFKNLYTLYASIQDAYYSENYKGKLAICGFDFSKFISCTMDRDGSALISRLFVLASSPSLAGKEILVYDRESDYSSSLRMTSSASLNVVLSEILLDLLKDCEERKIETTLRDHFTEFLNNSNNSRRLPDALTKIPIPFIRIIGEKEKCDTDTSIEVTLSTNLKGELIFLLDASVTLKYHLPVDYDYWSTDLEELATMVYFVKIGHPELVGRAIAATAHPLVS